MKPVQINITESASPKNAATIDKEGAIGNTFSKQQVRDEISKLSSGVKGILRISSPKPEVEAIGEYRLSDFGKYINLVPIIPFGETNPTNSPITTDSFYNSVYWDGTKFTHIKAELPSNTAFIESFTTSNFPLFGEIQRTYSGKTWQLKAGETADIDEVPGISEKWELLSIGAIENAEIKALKQFSMQASVSEQDISFSVTDKEGLMSWLSADKQGGMPEFVKSYVASQVGDKIFERKVQNEIIFSVTDSKNNLSWLTVGKDGGMPDFVEDYLSSKIISKYESKTRSKKNEINCVGDSITEGGSPGSSYPAHLQNLLGDSKVVTNQGHSGRMSADLAVWAGGTTPTLTTLLNIPTSGPTANTTPFTTVTIGKFKGYSVSGTLGGIHGTLTCTEDAASYYFTRTASGAAVTLPIGTQFISDGLQKLDNIMIWWTGQNDLAFGWPYYETAPLDCAQATIDMMNVDIKRFLVVGVTNGSTNVEFKTVTDKINSNLKKHFPDNFVDMQNIMIDKGLAMAGLTPTSEDLSAIADRRVPPSLLFDFVHPNDICKKKVIAQTIYNELAKRDWL